VADWARPKGKKGSALLGYRAKTERGEGIRRIPFFFCKAVLKFHFQEILNSFLNSVKTTQHMF
jgi:hypothetical protein